MHIIVRAAPVAAFGAMGFTVGSYGIAALNRLVALMAGFYLTAALFVILVLGMIAWHSGFSIFRYIGYIKEELLLVLGTSSSETALPGMIEKMQRLGCAKSTVGLVIPTATASTSTAPTSTWRWLRCSSRRRPTRRWICAISSACC